MPTYQYACTECEHSFEQFQSFTDDALTVCPVCEGRLRKVFNAVGVVFKGSGFYRNDSRTDGKSSTGGGAPAKSSSDKSESSTSDTSSASSEKSTSDKPKSSSEKKSPSTSSTSSTSAA